MRSSLASAFIALALIVSPSGARGQVVTSFHGYAWGTPGTEIAEIAGRPRVGEKDALAIHSADLTFLGRDVLAGFYLHPVSEKLVEGAYVFHVALEECQATWERTLEWVKEEYPELPLEVERTSRSGADLEVYDSDCGHYVYNLRDGDPDWRAEFVGEDASRGRVLVRLHAVGRSLRITVLFQGAAAKAWAERDRPEPTFPRPAS